MLLTPEEIKQQTRELWQKSFHDSDEFMNLYFEEKYTDDVNLTLRSNGVVVAAMQVFPYRTTFYGQVIHAAYLSGLCIDEGFRNRGMASQLLHEAHRRLYRQGTAISFLIPADEGLRHFYEQENHGAYWTSTFRKEMAYSLEGETDPTVEVSQPDEWGNDLYVFFQKSTFGRPFALHPSENDFFAALADCDLEGGSVLVARRGRKIVGFCMGKKIENGRFCVTSLVSSEQTVTDSLLHYIAQHESVTDIFTHVPASATDEGAVPYAMARVVNVKKLLQAVLLYEPDFELSIGVGGDRDIPENNGYYQLRGGKVIVTDQEPETIVTPGGLVAMLLSLQPTFVEMMLDE